MAAVQTLERPQAPEAPSSPLWVDTHAHLDDPAFDPDRDAVLARARAAGVEVVLVSTSLASAAKVVALAREHGLACAVGVHPQHALRAPEGFEGTLAGLLEAPEVVAVGEIGLDFYRDYAPRTVQERVLRSQLELARAHGRPVVLHHRGATAEVLAAVRAYPGLRGVFHCFTGSREEAEAIFELGFELGLGGALTFKKNEGLRRVVSELPLERLVLETDCPYLAPEPRRGRRNEPAFLPHVGRVLAALFGLALEEVAVRTTANARALFRLTS